MSVRSIKNTYRRKLYFLLETEILALRYLARMQNLPFNTRWLARVYLSNHRQNCRSRLANHCFLTLRRRGFIRFMGLSRLQMRSLARNGDLPFISKASW